MNFPIKAFARMARASRFSREDAESRLRGKVSEAELKIALDRAYAEDPDVLAGLFLGGAEVIGPALATGDGKNVDDRGHDEADRAALALMQALNKDCL